MKRPITAPLFLVLLLVLGCSREEAAAPEPLLCYVGGTMRPAMEELARAFEAETGRRILLDYGDSGANLIKIQTTNRGDLNVCHDPFQNALWLRGQSAGGYTVATLTPAIAVPKGNPKGIRNLEDLTREGLRLGLTHETYSTLGHLCEVIFKRAGVAGRIEKNVTTRMRQGGEVANAVIQGHLDAAIVWDAVVHVRGDKLDAVPIAREHLPQPGIDVVTTATFGHIDMGSVKVTIDVLTCSRDEEAAAAFAAFAASPRGRAVFQAHGFSPAPGGVAAAGQTLLLYCGAGLRPAVAELIQVFGAETGIAVACDYAGSGILLSRIELAKRGDLYLPGELEYVDDLEKKGLVDGKHPVAWFVPVIMVRKGNPRGIAALADLVKPGVRLGLGNPQACHIGRVAGRIFAKNGIDAAAVERNLAFSSLTVNELGVQIKAGQVDAVIVWDAIAACYTDAADVIPIPPEQNDFSRVGIAVLSCSERKEQANRFVSFLTGAKGVSIFAKHGYRTAPPEGASPAGSSPTGASR